MRLFLNLLGAILLLLLLLARGRFQIAIEAIEQGKPRDHTALRRLIGPTSVALVVFVAVAAWALVDAGYPVLAILLAAHLAMLLEVGTRQRPDVH